MDQRTCCFQHKRGAVMTPNDPKELTAEEKQALLGELSATELAKLINDEYGMVLAGEHRTFQRAQAIGEMLVAFRRGTGHGEWQSKLAKWCPKLSYETANRYTKLFQNRTEIARLAEAKNVTPTDLTIEAALKLLSERKARNDNNKSDDGKKSSKAVKAAVEPANEPNSRRDEDIAKQYLAEVWDASELVDVLRQVRDIDYLMELAAAVAKALTPTPTVPQATTASSAASGFERRY
jgi:hypothetical protein